ncbi:MAG: sugar ABC transporter permease [Caldilineaceae bacterium SB0664_bin_27]|uniref:Sugar ABC transporter permease n=1 Tax=Caldilineaceae bacterium SB0664_bin_27 TaxID=2605260 RepID=A0A6B0YLJ2_9CHLR|nr:sugar ABC transporter permease [Caldilineaceae bacterium SB0664_bin_27]
MSQEAIPATDSKVTADLSAKPRSVWASPIRRREARDGIVFILPWFLGLLIFILGPFVAGFYYSLTEYDSLLPANWLGVENYRRILFDDDRFWLTVYNTVWYVCAAVVPQVILGLLLAVLLNQKARGITVFRTVFFMPSIVPIVASVSLFIFILHDRFGLLNETLYQVFGIVGPNWLTSPDWSKPSLVLWSLWGIGGGMIIYLAGLQGIPQTLYEAAAIDGAGALRCFWKITIPLISPTILFVVIMGIIGSFQIFTPVFLLGSANYGLAAAGPMDSLLFWVVYIYNQGFFYFRMGYASAIAWLLFMLLVVLTLIQFRLAGRWVYYEDEAAIR